MALERVKYPREASALRTVRNPEEDEDGLACETMGPFKNVVSLCAEGWVCGGKDGDAEGEDYVYDQNSRESRFSQRSPFRSCKTYCSGNCEYSK